MQPANDRLRRALLSALLIAAMPVCLYAQATPAAATSPVTDPESEPLELSPFEVDASRDVGYLATNTLAGSRFNTSLKDTPATISVMTAEFLADIGATQIEDAMRYAVNVEFFNDDDRQAINGNSIFSNFQTYRVRGLEASRTRNFFSMSGRAVPDEMAFVERIEDSRGPNSVMAGISQPGGTINSSTKQARLTQAFERSSVMLGSYDSKRVTLDVNRPLGRKLAVRLNAVYNDNNEFRLFQHQTHLRAMLSATYQLSERTRIRAELERGEIESNQPTGDTLRDYSLAWMDAGRPTAATQVAIANTVRLNQTNRHVTYIANGDNVMDLRGTLQTTGSNNTITDPKIADYSINWGGLAQNRFLRFGVFSAFLEHQITKNTFFEIAFNHAEQTFDNRQPRGTPQQLLGDPNQRLNGANNALNGGGTNPYAGRLFLESSWFRTDRWDLSDTGRVMLSHVLDLRKWGNYRFVGGIEYEKRFFRSRLNWEQWRDASTGAPPFNAAPDNVLNRVYRRTYVTEGQWDTYSLSGPVGNSGMLNNITDPVNGRTLSSAWVQGAAPIETYVTQKTGNFAAQARYFSDRLIVMGGLRRDEYDDMRLATARDSVTQVWGIIRDPNDPGVARNSVIGRSKTFGAVFHATPRISLISNVASNVSVPVAGQYRLDPSGDPLKEPLLVPNPTGRGRDYGIGLNLIDNRLYLRVTRYTTQATDQSTTSPSRVRTNNLAIMDLLLANGLIGQAEYDKRTDVGGSGLFGDKSTGVEFELTGNVTDNWRVTMSYSKTKALENYRFTEWLKWEKINDQFLQPYLSNQTVGGTISTLLDGIHDELLAQTQSVGVGKFGNREHKFSTTTRYNFRQGLLRNTYVGASYRHQSKMFVGTDPATGDNLYGNSYGYADVFLGYTAPRFYRNLRLSFQLNVYNVLNKRKPLVIRYSTTDPTVVFRNLVQPPTTWRFTTNIEF